MWGRRVWVPRHLLPWHGGLCVRPQRWVHGDGLRHRPSTSRRRAAGVEPLERLQRDLRGWCTHQGTHLQAWEVGWGRVSSHINQWRCVMVTRTCTHTHTHTGRIDAMSVPCVL